MVGIWCNELMLNKSLGHHSSLWLTRIHHQSSKCAHMQVLICSHWHMNIDPVVISTINVLHDDHLKTFAMCLDYWLYVPNSFLFTLLLLCYFYYLLDKLMGSVMRTLGGSLEPDQVVLVGRQPGGMGCQPFSWQLSCYKHRTFLYSSFVK